MRKDNPLLMQSPFATPKIQCIELTRPLNVPELKYWPNLVSKGAVAATEASASLAGDLQSILEQDLENLQGAVVEWMQNEKKTTTVMIPERIQPQSDLGRYPEWIQPPSDLGQQSLSCTRSDSGRFWLIVDCQELRSENR
jgi:hypothetical protein